jgi:hypothetical protein
MIICFRFAGVEHCYNIPIIEIPVPIFRPGPGPVNYPAFLHDATVVAGINAAIGKISDKTVQEALRGGVNSAIQALQKRGGEHVGKISLQ